jgi:hypothetical protein
MTKRKNSAPDSIITKRVKLDIEERSMNPMISITMPIMRQMKIRTLQKKL